MKTLIVEDNDIKYKKISDFLEDNFKEFTVTRKSSYSSAVKYIKEEAFDFLILDMSLPTYDRVGLESGGRVRIFGGKEIASQLKRKSITTPFIILTQYDSFTTDNKTIKISDLESEFLENYGSQFHGTIYFDAINISWKCNLESVLKDLLCLKS